MSADRWSICPRCVDRARATRAALSQQAADAYGTVPADEYERLVGEARSPVDTEAFRTFREDYEFYGVGDGVIVASYGGACQTCSLSIQFDDKHPFYEPTTEPVTE